MRYNYFGSKRLLMIKGDHERRCDHTICKRDNCLRRLANYGYISRRNGGPCKYPRRSTGKLWDVDQFRRDGCGWYGHTARFYSSKFTVHKGQYANQNKKPIVFDPVGVGATSFRKHMAAGTPLPRADPVVYLKSLESS